MRIVRVWATVLFLLVCIGALLHAALIATGAPMAAWLWWIVAVIVLAPFLPRVR